MNEEFRDEIEAITSIYGLDTLREAHSSAANIYLFSPPGSAITLRMSIPMGYPKVSPKFVGTQSIGEVPQKGQATHIFECAREALTRVFVPGSVCLFDLLQELEHVTASDELHNGDGFSPREMGEQPSDTHEIWNDKDPVKTVNGDGETFFGSSPPAWTISDPLTVKKSVFLARAYAVSSVAEARAAITHLKEADRKVAKAAHNITAYRIHTTQIHSKLSRQSSQHQEAIFQDCDDDGESAAGGRLLHLLQVMDVWGLLVVVSRWYGGVKLGPDRFKCISEVAREAIVKGR